VAQLVGICAGTTTTVVQHHLIGISAVRLADGAEASALPDRRHQGHYVLRQCGARGMLLEFEPGQHVGPPLGRLCPCFQSS
jgi:hypothetical protein